MDLWEFMFHSDYALPADGRLVDFPIGDLQVARVTYIPGQQEETHSIYQADNCGIRVLAEEYHLQSNQELTQLEAFNVNNNPTGYFYVPRVMEPGQTIYSGPFETQIIWQDNQNHQAVGQGQALAITQLNKDGDILTVYEFYKEQFPGKPETSFARAFKYNNTQGLIELKDL